MTGDGWWFPALAKWKEIYSCVQPKPLLVPPPFHLAPFIPVTSSSRNKQLENPFDTFIEGGYL